MVTLHLRIEFMRGEADLRRVRTTLMNHRGAVLVEARMGSADLEYDPVFTSVEDITMTLDRAGFPARREAP